MKLSNLILFSSILFLGLNCSPPADKFETGIITKTSSNSVDSTYNVLKELISTNPNLSVIAELDHQENAKSVNLELPPTRIILFGNPKLGTPLMQESQITGLDLPQKILVFQDSSGKVKVSYNDPEYLRLRHGLTEQEEILGKISNALDMITEKAIQR